MSNPLYPIPSPIGKNGDVLTAEGGKYVLKPPQGSGGVELPSQSGQNGKVLGTNGTTLSWVDQPKAYDGPPIQQAEQERVMVGTEEAIAGKFIYLITGTYRVPITNLTELGGGRYNLFFTLARLVYADDDQDSILTNALPSAEDFTIARVFPSQGSHLAIPFDAHLQKDGSADYILCTIFPKGDNFVMVIQQAEIITSSAITNRDIDSSDVELIAFSRIRLTHDSY